MAGKLLSADYAPSKRAVPSLAASWSRITEQIHALVNDPLFTGGQMTDRQNGYIRGALLDAINTVGGEDEALRLGKLAQVSFNVTTAGASYYSSLT